MIYKHFENSSEIFKASKNNITIVNNLGYEVKI